MNKGLVVKSLFKFLRIEFGRNAKLVSCSHTPLQLKLLTALNQSKERDTTKYLILVINISQDAHT